MSAPWWTRPRDTWTRRERARYAWWTVRDRLEQRVVAPLQCATSGHLWDFDRPAGPIHARDICWRCSRTRKVVRP